MKMKKAPNARTYVSELFVWDMERIDGEEKKREYTFWNDGHTRIRISK